MAEPMKRHLLTRWPKTTTMTHKSIIAINVLSSLLLLLGACNCVSAHALSVVPDSVTIEKFIRHEWISFDAYRERSNLWGKTKESTFQSRIYIHNIDSTRQHVAIVGSRMASLITPDTIFFVDIFHADKGFFVRGENPDRNGETHYDWLAIDELQDELEYFPMYLNDCFQEVCGRVTLPTDEKKYVRMADHIRIEASIVHKYCYAEYCELQEDPFRLYYNPRLQLFDRGEFRIDFDYYGFSLCNFSYDDASPFIDSLFDFANYPNYDLCSGSQYLPSRCGSSNTALNDTVLDYPIINLATGDTTTLASMQGWTLLYFDYFESRSTYQAMQEFKGAVDNIVWLMPCGNNVDMLRQIASEAQLGNDTYYTKGFQLHLRSANGIYLIAPDHTTAYSTGSSYIHDPKKSIKNLMKNKGK